MARRTRSICRDLAPDRSARLLGPALREGRMGGRPPRPLFRIANEARDGSNLPVRRPAGGFSRMTNDDGSMCRRPAAPRGGGGARPEAASTRPGAAPALDRPDARPPSIAPNQARRGNASDLKRQPDARESRGRNACRLAVPGRESFPVITKSGRDRAVPARFCVQVHLDDVAGMHRDAGIESGERTTGSQLQPLLERVEQQVVGRPEGPTRAGKPSHPGRLGRS